MSALDSRLACVGCGAALPPQDPMPFRCPNADAGDDRDHVLARTLDLADTIFPLEGDPQPFVRFRALLHSYRFARRSGASDADYVARVRRLDDAVAAVDGAGLRATPYTSNAALAQELGLDSLWIKDETGGVAGSHKARHLMGIALQLDVAGAPGDAPLAIASCGNAALAAAVVAQAAGRGLDAYVPAGADAGVPERLRELGANLVACPRADGAAGDPCLARLREAVRAGAVPFTCQGTENGLTIEGGETLAWELIAQHAIAGALPIGDVAIQVGGGALGSACVQAFREACALGAVASLPRFFFVQTRGGHPLERAWRLVTREILRNMDARGAGTPGVDAPDGVLAGWLREHAASPAVRDELALAAAQRSRYMRPWGSAPHSAASGILDDETYDWLVLVEAMIETGGWPVVVTEETIEHAWRHGRELTGVDVDATGTAGLAGLYSLAREGALERGTAAVVLFTGAQR